MQVNKEKKTTETSTTQTGQVSARIIKKIIIIDEAYSSYLERTVEKLLSDYGAFYLYQAKET